MTENATKNVFDVFMSEHAPISELVERANKVLWDQSALDPVLKERMRIALAEAIGCSYCARFRTDLEGALVLEADAELSAQDQRRAELLEHLAAMAIARGEHSQESLDEHLGEIQKHFSEAEFTDVIFSLGWFSGMQYVGRLMHWDAACPVAPIRRMVEAGEAA